MGLTNHTILLARDGRELAIAASGVPIRQPGGPMLGMVLVCRDCSEARRAEAALREGAHYRSLFENMPDGFVYGKLLFENGQPQDFIHVDVNRAFETLTGLHDVVGKRASEVMPGLKEANPEFFAIHGRVVQTGNPESFEMYVRGLNKWIAATGVQPEKGTLCRRFRRHHRAPAGRGGVSGFSPVFGAVQRHTEIPPSSRNWSRSSKISPAPRRWASGSWTARATSPIGPIRLQPVVLREGKPPVDSCRSLHVHQCHQGRLRPRAPLLFRRRLLLYERHLPLSGHRR